MKYIKKPIPIEAIKQDKEFQVETLEGTMKGKPGDYLVTGIQGEQYPCDGDIFEDTYDSEDDVEPMVPQNSSELCNELYDCIKEHLVKRTLTNAQIIGELELLKNRFTMYGIITVIEDLKSKYNIMYDWMKHTNSNLENEVVPQLNHAKELLLKIQKDIEEV